MSLNLDLSNSLAKIARANEHFESLEAEIQIVNKERSPYEPMLRHDKDTGWYSVILASGDFNEPHLGVILGDLVNNLRSALNYIVVALAEKGGVAVTKDHQFPICDDPLEYSKNAPRMLHGIVCGTVEIESLQPFNRTSPEEDPLFVINFFSNADKHRVISNYHPVLDKAPRAKLTPANIVERQIVTQPPKQWRPNTELTLGRYRYAVEPSTPVSLNMEVTTAVYFAVPKFGKHPRGFAAPFRFFKHAKDHVAMIVDTFKAL